MKPTYNHVELMGCIRGPVHTIQCREKFNVSFLMATTGTIKNESDGYEPIAEWHRVNYGRARLDLIRNMRDGAHIFVIGSLHTAVVSSATGNLYIAAEVHAHQIKLLGQSEELEHPLPSELSAGGTNPSKIEPIVRRKAMGAPVAVEPPSSSNIHPGARR
jgi:single-stranded DNA-binding protein